MVRDTHPAIAKDYSRPDRYGVVPWGAASAFGVAIVMGICAETVCELRTTRPSGSFVTRTGSVTSSGTLYVHRQESYAVGSRWGRMNGLWAVPFGST